MAENWRRVESLVKPVEVDKNSTASGVYVRKNIEKITTQTETEEEIEKYSYLECLMTTEEYESYELSNNIVNKVLDKDISPEGQKYESDLDEPVLYTNGLYYKPSYINDYKKVMDDVKTALDILEKCGGETTQILGMKVTVYDATGLPANARQMSIAEIIQLYFFLYLKKEELYNTYKASKAGETEEE